MNRKLLIGICFLIALMGAGRTYAQNGVFILSLDSFPVLPDTAYEGIQYNFSATVSNGTNGMVTGTMQLMLGVDTNMVAAGPSTQVTMQPLDTVTIVVTAFDFTPSVFKAGNNIVVVWPAITGGTNYQIDSTTVNVYFVPLNGLHGPRDELAESQLYPNPSHDYVQCRIRGGTLPERVRIYDITGRLTMDLDYLSNLDVQQLAPGTYLIEMIAGKQHEYMQFIKPKD